MSYQGLLCTTTAKIVAKVPMGLLPTGHSQKVLDGKRGQKSLEDSTQNIR